MKYRIELEDDGGYTASLEISANSMDEAEEEAGRFADVMVGWTKLRIVQCRPFFETEEERQEARRAKWRRQKRAQRAR